MRGSKPATVNAPSVRYTQSMPGAIKSSYLSSAKTHTKLPPRLNSQKKTESFNDSVSLSLTSKTA